MSHNNLTDRERLSKKATARHLILIKGYSQKEAAHLLGVSEQTMSNWAKKHHWNEAKDNDLKGGLSTIIEDFISFVEKKRPGMGSTVKSLWQQYLDTRNKPQ